MLNMINSISKFNEKCRHSISPSLPLNHVLSKQQSSWAGGDIDTFISKAFNHLLNSWPPPIMYGLRLLACYCTVTTHLAAENFLKAPSWFSSEIPNDTPENNQRSHSSSKKLCKILDGYLREEAVQEGMNSATTSGQNWEFLLLWIVHAWKWGNGIGKKCKRHRGPVLTG